MSAESMKKIDQSFWDQTICSGRLFLQMGPKRLSLLEAGQVIDKNYLEKYKNSDLYLESVVNEVQLTEYKNLFTQLKSKKFEKEQREIAKLIVESVLKEWHDPSAHILTFAKACFESLNFIPMSELLKIDGTDLRLFKKSLYASALSVIIGISNDYFEFNLLKDLYQITFILDFGLCESSYSYHMANAVEAESIKPGAGLEYLEQSKASTKEKELFLKHPEKSHDLIESLSFHMTYPELMEIVLYQHETISGTGFPRGITKREVSTWDAVCLYADGIVSMSALEKLETHTIDYLLDKSYEKQEALPIKKVFARFKETMSYFDNYQLEEDVA